MIPDYVNNWLGEWVWVPFVVLAVSWTAAVIWGIIDWIRDGRR